ncbi:MAG: tetratricopeptide repeat protein [Promethearchaeota archaeon]
MKPLGTITNCFPFLEDEISSELESLMGEALNYADFLDRVVKHILENESPPMMVFYAISQLHEKEWSKYLESVLERYQNHRLLQPFIMMDKLSLDEATTTDVLESANLVLRTASNLWIQFEMHYLRFLCASTYSLGSALEEEALDRLQSLIDSEPKMEFLQPRVVIEKASRLLLAGKVSDAIRLNELGIAQAQSFDDIYLLSYAYARQAYCLRHFDSAKALEMLDRVKEIWNTLGFDAEEHWGYCNIRHSVHNPRGEFDLSLQYLQRAIKIREAHRTHTSLRALPLNMTYVYAELEDGENALEWAKMAMANPQFMSGEPGNMALALIRLARAFALLGDIEQAEKYLEKSETESLKVGIDRNIAENYIVTGHIERAKGELESAMFHFERGLEIAEQVNHQNRINSCLIGLVKTEIDLLEVDETSALLNTSGPWMRLLQSEVERKELPGIRGVLLLLKAELRLKQGRMEEAGSLLEDIRSLAENPGLGYLGRKAEKLQSIIELEALNRKKRVKSSF